MMLSVPPHYAQFLDWKVARILSGTEGRLILCHSCHDAVSAFRADNLLTIALHEHESMARKTSSRYIEAECLHVFVTCPVIT